MSDAIKRLDAIEHRRIAYYDHDTLEILLTHDLPALLAFARDVLERHAELQDIHGRRGWEWCRIGPADVERAARYLSGGAS